MLNLKLDKKAIETAIYSLAKVSYSTTSIEDLESMLTPLFTGLKHEVPRYQPGVELYRGTDLGNKPVSISEVHCPPEEKITKMGRLNRVGESVFYGATARNVPFFELKRQPGQYICISRWISTKQMILNHVGFSDECRAILNSNRPLENLYQFIEATQGFGDINKKVYDFISYAFSRRVLESENEYYKLTNAIGRKLLGKNGLLSGILYPTIAMSGNADNIVLEKDFANQALALKSVEFICIKSAQSQKYKIDVIDTATVFEADGTIKWNERPW